MSIQLSKMLKQIGQGFLKTNQYQFKIINPPKALKNYPNEENILIENLNLPQQNDKESIQVKLFGITIQDNKLTDRFSNFSLTFVVPEESKLLKYWEEYEKLRGYYDEGGDLKLVSEGLQDLLFDCEIDLLDHKQQIKKRYIAKYCLANISYDTNLSGESDIVRITLNISSMNFYPAQ